jgi:2-hydroxychromene-2-carboxylate isomerase
LLVRRYAEAPWIAYGIPTDRAQMWRRSIMPENRELTFYFDYISPNAHIAWTQLPTLVERHNLRVNLVPVLFAGLLRAHGQMGPAEQAAKRSWMSQNITRQAPLLGVPLSPPKRHPFNPLLSLRASSIK